jgi:radical SAM superfamily enzyme YgiQ (UPF0313 family)
VPSPNFGKQQFGEQDIISPYVPLGLLSVATVLDRSNFDVRIIDVTQPYSTLDSTAAAEMILNQEPGIIGFSTICNWYPLTLQVAELCKQKRPGSIIVLGGPQASVTDVTTIRSFPYIDVIMRGECEHNITPLFSAISSGQCIHDIPGITFRDGTQIVRTVQAPLTAVLDDLPLPDYSLMPEIENFDSLPIEVGRGCPFRCTFCSTKGFFQRRFRFRKTEYLLKLIVDLHEKYGICRFEFVHDNVTVSKEKMLELCNGMKQLGLDARWTCSARVDCLDRELIDRMAEAGCEGIFMGIETGSKRMQRVIGKRLNLDKVAKVIERISDRAIRFTASFIMGFPDETLEDLEMTIRLMTLLRFKGNGSEIVQLHMLSPAPGTEMYEENKSNLFFDGHIPDTAFADLTEDMRAIVENHLEVFASFGYYGTKHLDRQFLLKVNFVFLSLLYLFPYTTLALLQSMGSSFPGQLLGPLSFVTCPETVWFEVRAHTRINTVYPFLKECLHELGPRKEMIQEVLLYEKTANDLQYDVVKDDAHIIRKFRYDVERWITQVANGAIPELSDFSRGNAHYILFLKNDGKVKTVVLPRRIGRALTSGKKSEN